MKATRALISAFDSSPAKAGIPCSGLPWAVSWYSKASSVRSKNPFEFSTRLMASVPSPLGPWQPAQYWPYREAASITGVAVGSTGAVSSQFRMKATRSSISLSRRGPPFSWAKAGIIVLGRPSPVTARMASSSYNSRKPLEFRTEPTLAIPSPSSPWQEAHWSAYSSVPRRTASRRNSSSATAMRCGSFSQ